MLKKSSSTIPEPSTEEISNSKYCTQVIESFHSFQQLDDSNINNNIFNTFINDLYNFVSNETNLNLVKYYATSMLQEAMKFSSKSEIQIENSTLLFDILDKILSITMNLNFDDVSIFILSLISNIQAIGLLNSHIKTLDTLFSNELFFTNFTNQQFTSEFFEKSFINFVSIDLCILFRHLICEVSPKSLQQNINLSKILSFLLASIRPEIQVEYSIVLSKLISINSRNRHFLNNMQSFILFSDNIQSASSNIIIDCFNDLVFTQPFNLDLFSNIILFYQKYPQHQTSLFHWIFYEVIKNHTDMLYEINNIIPYFSWITLSTPVPDAIDAINILSKHDISLVSPFISPLFSLLNRGGSTFEYCRSTIEIIEKQIQLRQISLNFLANSLFLKTFIVNTEIGILGQLFDQIYTFSQLVYDIYTLPQSESLRADVINRLIQMASKFPKTAHFISIFLVVSNSRKNISDLMQAIIENKNGDLCKALGDSFAKSSSVVRFFLNGNGMKWLDRVFSMKIIKVQQFVFLINSLTCNFFIKEVDKYIEQLPETHPIFSVSGETLRTLCYGFEDSQSSFPLKIMALFPRLKTPQKVDPFNAYMIGKYAINKFENMADLPYFSDVVNRYIDDRTFQKIIQMKAEKFESFCNPKFDHFPLFQVYEYLDDNIFEISFKAISFWFKFGEDLRSELKIPFFHSDKLQLYLKGRQLIANYEGVEYDADLNPFNWNNVIVVVATQKVSHYVEVYVNLNKAVFISSRQMSELQNFEFSTYSAYLFVGPAIRIYQNENVNKDMDMIFKNGPSFTGRLNESFIITPNSKDYLKPGKSILSVKYRGFPVHFLSKKKMTILFDRMSDPKCKKDEFMLFHSTCFKIYSLLRNSLNDFFRSILTIYSKKNEFVNLELLMKTFEFFLKYKSKNEIIDTIIGHKQFWSSIPNDIIIISLLSKITSFEFYKEKEKLEIFFAIKTFYKYDNPKLFMDLILASKNCQFYIHELFTGSHFMCKMQDKFTQCYLDTKSLSNQPNSENRESNCVSIQCNLSESNEMLNNYPANFDLINSFQTIKTTPFQKTFANLLKQLIITTQNISFIPLDGIYSLFITCDTEMKASLYPALLSCERIVPNSIRFDSTFLSCVPQLFKYKEIWTETFDLLINDSDEISKPSLLPVLFSLIWGYSAASIHSIASTGKPVIQDEKHKEEITRIMSFLQNEENIKIVSNDKNVQKFVVSWFPFLLGYRPHKLENEIKRKDLMSSHVFVSLEEGFETQNFKLNGVDVSSPSPFCFISMIWKNVIQESNLPMKTKNEYYKELQSFIVSSPVFGFFFSLIFSHFDSHFNEFLSPFISVPLISEDNDLAKYFVCDFVHSLLNVVAESYTLTTKISLIFPYIHFMCISGQITSSFLPTFVSDLFLVSSVIDAVYKSSFNKLVPHLNLLLLNLLSTSLTICIENKNDQENNSKLINVLYQVLLQQIHFLIQIAVESKKEIDLYLLFFQQSFRFCSKSELYNTVITEFGKKMQIVDDPQFQSLISMNNVENSGFEMSKWDEFIKTKISPIINHDEIFNISFSHASECSKSFTSSFFSSFCEQRQIAEDLPELFSVAKKFGDSKVDWGKTLQDIYQMTNDTFYKGLKLSVKTVTSQISGKKILMPFMMPLRIPRLFVCVPPVFENDSFDIFHFIDEMNLYKSRLESLDDFVQLAKNNSSGFDETNDIIECEVKRCSEKIQSIMIVLKNDILILPFCKLSQSSKRLCDMNYSIDPNEVAQFVREVICGMWGNSIVYMNRIVIRLPVNSILFVSQIGSDSIAIWSITSGHFIIDKLTNDVANFVSNFKLPLHPPLKVRSLEKLIVCWKNAQVSNSQLLLGVNMFNGRVFADKDKFPLLPNDATVFGAQAPLTDMLSKSLCHSTFPTRPSLASTIEDSQTKTAQFIADTFMMSLNIDKIKPPLPLFESTLKFLNQKLSTEKLVDGKLIDIDVQDSARAKVIFNTPRLSARISDDDESVFVEVDAGRQALAIVDYRRGKVVCEERSPLLAAAKSLRASENRLFFAIDFANDITCVYQVVRADGEEAEGGQPSFSFRFVRDMSFLMPQRTAVSGVDWVAATAVCNRLFVWHFFPNTVHAVVEFEETISFATIDENIGAIWVITKQRGASDQKDSPETSSSNEAQNSDDSNNSSGKKDSHETSSTNEAQNAGDSGNSSGTGEAQNAGNSGNSSGTGEAQNAGDASNSSDQREGCGSPLFSGLYCERFVDDGLGSSSLTFSLVSLNGDVIARTSLQVGGARVTCLSPVPHSPAVSARSAVCGLSDGSLLFLSVSVGENAATCDIKITKLDSPHERPIRAIVFNCRCQLFVTVDSANVAHVWTQSRADSGIVEGRAFLDFSAFEGCASCGGCEVKRRCGVCGRAFCQECLGDGETCDECKRI